MRLAPACLTVAALGLVAANDPPPIQVAPLDANPALESFDQFALAALACIEATQSQEVSSDAIAKRGWTEYPQKDPEVAKLAATFSRKDSHVFVVVDKRSQQCDVNWPVSSPSGPDAVFTTADAKVSKTLSDTYRKRLETMPPPPIMNGRVHRFMAAESIGMLGVETVGGGMTVKFGSINKANLERALRSASQRPSTEPQGH